MRQFSDLSSADVYWQISNGITRRLIPIGKTRFASISQHSPEDFDKLSLTELQGLNYSQTPLNGNDDKSNQLFKGSVFAVEMESDGLY